MPDVLRYHALEVPDLRQGSGVTIVSPDQVFDVGEDVAGVENPAKELFDSELPRHEREEAQEHPLVADDLRPSQRVLGVIPTEQEPLTPENNDLLVVSA